MTPDRYRVVNALFDAVLDCPAEERPIFLDQAAGLDHDLRREVEELIENHFASESFLVPPAGVPATSRPLPSAIGPYYIRKQLGEGGMGTVYLAAQSEPIRRDVALKVIKPGMGSKSVIARFNGERRTLAMMDHPYIAQVFDAGTTTQGLPYFVMELVEGLPITVYCDRKQLGLRERINLLIHVCEAIQYAHQKGIIHRDIKPSNVLVREIEGKPIPKVIDFGLAKALDPALSTSATRTDLGTVLGTLQYMSPEQAQLGRQDIDTRSDIYSLGVLFYELLTGKTPLDLSQFPTHQGYLNLIRRIQEEEPKPPSTHWDKHTASTQNRRLRGDLDSIVLKALEKDPSRRYNSPAELAADIERYLRHEPVIARPTTLIYRARKYARRHSLGVSFALIATLLVASWAVTEAIQLRRVQRERDRTNRVTQFMIEMFKISDPSESRGNDIRAREILDYASAGTEKTLNEEPELQAQMMHTIGSVYESLGLYVKADSLVRRAVGIRLRILGTGHLLSIRSMVLLALILDEEDHYQESEQWSRQALAAGTSALGPEQRDTVLAMLQLSRALNDEGRIAESLSLNRKAIEIARRVYGPRDPLLRQAIRQLGFDLEYQSKEREAEHAYREAFNIDWRLYGSRDNLNILKDLDDIGGTLYLQGRSFEAEALLSDVLERRRRILGPDHPQTLLTMQFLASALRSQHRYTEAERLFRKTLAGRQKSHGLEDRWTLHNMTDLADVLLAEGQTAEAEQLLRRSIEIQRRTLGPDHHNTLQSLLILGKTLQSQKRYPEAEQVLRDSLHSWTRGFGPHHASSVMATYRLGLVLAAQRKSAEALSQLQYALAGDLDKSERASFDENPELDSLRGDPRFPALVSLSRQNR